MGEGAGPVEVGQHIVGGTVSYGDGSPARPRRDNSEGLGLLRAGAAGAQVGAWDRTAASTGALRGAAHGGLHRARGRAFSWEHEDRPHGTTLILPLCSTQPTKPHTSKGPVRRAGDLTITDGGQPPMAFSGCANMKARPVESLLPHSGGILEDKLSMRTTGFPAQPSLLPGLEEQVYQIGYGENSEPRTS
ncbi:hypothetical protein H920_00400 [Fukomys damarensis]|uniref:Uncharacterized protein n=1 Tax=Fukomys damarensis TaxID=885580 RepID=A0A091E1J6_FUKDA|nr:hypothetical protein H920_00400 [Fukomys damarensis]